MIVFALIWFYCWCAVRYSFAALCLLLDCLFYSLLFIFFFTCTLVVASFFLLLCRCCYRQHFLVSGPLLPFASFSLYRSSLATHSHVHCAPVLFPQYFFFSSSFIVEKKIVVFMRRATHKKTLWLTKLIIVRYILGSMQYIVAYYMTGTLKLNSKYSIFSRYFFN